MNLSAKKTPSTKSNSAVFAASAAIALIAMFTPAYVSAVEAPAGAGSAAQPTKPDSKPQDGKTLSEKLDEGNGVIVPPEAHIDEGIKVPAPDPNPGTTRVIAPPGSPGGDQSVEPK